jgi:crotonobetainyl-CoA:carnitine CoA-transferase CaiB-like acyl-CoA transferase
MAFNVVQGAALLFGQPEPVREGERLNGGSLYDFYETRDGQYMSLGGLEPQFFKAFCEALERPDLVAGGIAPREIDKVKSEIRDIFKSRTRAEWEDIFRKVDACVEPVLSLSEALNSGLARSRGMVMELRLPRGGAIRQLANPIRFSRPRQEAASPGVPSGAHTKEIVLGLGYSEEEYLALEREGTFS